MAHESVAHETSWRQSDDLTLHPSVRAGATDADAVDETSGGLVDGIKRDLYVRDARLLILELEQHSFLRDENIELTEDAIDDLNVPTAPSA